MNVVKKGFFISFLVVFVLGFVSVENLRGDDVDDIYTSLVNSAPKYEVEESIVTYQSEGMSIVCTLTVPKSSALHPIILLVHGFGGERHGFPVTGTNDGYHDRFARILAQNGFCVLRPDFRGSGETGGGFELTTFTGQRSDSIAALGFIKTLGAPVNHTKIGMAGHSQGGLVTAITSAADKRIKSACILAGVSHPAHDFEGLLLKEGIRRGIAHAPGTVDMYGIWVEGVHFGDVPLAHEFFTELFSVAPLVDITNYKRPLMYVSTLQDVVVWPQPNVGQSYMKFHEGREKLVHVDSGHNFSYMDGPAKVDETGYWMAAWFIHTLK